MSTKLSRRDFLNIAKYTGAAILAAIVSSYYTTKFEPSWLEVSQVNIKLPKLPNAFNNYRIVQISDIHIGGWMNRDRLSSVVKLVMKYRPDLVVITGDYVIGHSWSRSLDMASADFIEVMKPLSQTHTVLGVMGNHDHWTDAALTRQMLYAAGIIELQNDVYQLEKHGESIYIAGVDDIFVGKAHLEYVDIKLPPNVPVILLAHEPDYAEFTSVTGKFMLQLSGHSHGGQVVLPFIGPPILPNWGKKFPAGLYDVNGMFLYTNRGVGMTSPFVRFNCRPEITVLTLNGPE